MWFSSEPPEHLTVFDGRIVASDKLDRQHRIKAYDETEDSWSEVGDGSRNGNPVVGLAAVGGTKLYAVSWEAFPTVLERMPTRVHREFVVSAEHEYDVHCSSDTDAEITTLTNDKPAVIEGITYNLQTDSNSSASNVLSRSKRDRTSSGGKAWWTFVASFVSTSKLDMAICTGVSL